MRAKAIVKKSPKATLVIGMTSLWSYSVFNEIAMATNMQECQNQEEDSYLPDFANAGVLRLGSMVGNHRPSYRQDFSQKKFNNKKILV